MDPVPVAPLSYRLICGSIYAVLSIFGLAAHSFIIFLFVRRSKSLLKTAFYFLALHMCICDSILLIVQLMIAVPLTLTANNFYADWNILFIYKICVFLETMFFNSLSYMTLWMAINRLTVFSSKTVNRVIFEKKGLICIVLFTYLLCLADASGRHFFGCTKDFSTKGFYFFFTCTEPIGSTFYHIGFYKDIVVPVAMFLIYFGLFLYLRAYLRVVDKNSEVFKGSVHSEYKLLVQGSIVCAFLEMETLAFDFFSKIPVTGMGIHYLTFIQNILQILNNCVSPVIYFTFNKDIQAYALETLGFGKGWHFAEI